MARSIINLSETFESTHGKFQQAILNEGENGAELKESEWFAYQEQLNDWIVKLEQTQKLIGIPLSEKDIARNVEYVAYATMPQVFFNHSE